MSVSNAVKQRIIGEYIKTPQGRSKLAASMTQPLRTRRDYAAVGRKTFLVEQLPDGALPIYDKDPDVTAYVVGEEGQNILAVTKPRRVIFPLFEIASNPEIPLTQIKERCFDFIEQIGKHTSELQSHHDLVCRLLLEKKKPFTSLPLISSHTLPHTTLSHHTTLPTLT